jgi:hypothetical protein
MRIVPLDTQEGSHRPCDSWAASVFWIMQRWAPLGVCLSKGVACAWGVSRWRDAAGVIGRVFRRRPSRRWQMQVRA